MNIGLKEVLAENRKFFADNSQDIATSVFLNWLVENEKYFDKEAGEYLESLLKQMSDGAITNISQMPDSKEKRRLIRQAAFVGNTHHKATNLLEGIQRSPVTTDQMSTVWSQDIIKTHQAVLDLLFDVVHSSSQKKQPVVYLALCYSCIDELTAALHLAGHHYYVQASNHLRTVLETIDRMDYFKKYPETVEVWAGNDKRRIRNEFRPSDIREKLGRNKFDPLYGYLSEIGTHPTFEMFKARALIDESDKTKARVYVSGTPYEGLRLMYYPISMLVATSLLGSVMRLFNELHNSEECIEITKENISNLKNFISDFYPPILEDNDEEFQEFLSVFDRYLKSLDEPNQVVGDLKSN